MKRLCILLVGMVVAWGLPCGDTAQGFPGQGGLAILGGFPFSLRSNAACAATGNRLMGRYSVRAGWLDQGDGSIWVLERQASTGTASWPLKGLWVQATEELTLDRSFGLLLSTGTFFPRRTEGTWSSRPDPASYDFKVPSYDWWFVDGIIKARASRSFEILAGFRWDHTSARVDYSDNTSDDYTLDSYLPVIGVQMNQRFSDGSLLIRFIGSPLVRGRVKYHFWDRMGFSEFGDFRVKPNSSFFEMLMDYRLKLERDVLAGAFVKWNWLRVRTGSQSLSGSTNESVAWAVDIKSWVIGGVVSLDFCFPF